jgi:hypothetical protein
MKNFKISIVAILILSMFEKQTVNGQSSDQALVAGLLKNYSVNTRPSVI